MTLTLAPELQAQTLRTLTELAALCSQAQAGFQSGADQAQAADVRSLLRRRADESRMQADELRAHVRRLGGEPAPVSPVAMTSGSVARSLAPEHVDAAVLEACERAEDAALERFTESLRQPLEPAAREAVQTQRLEIRRQHELLRTMHDRLRGLC